MPYAEAEAIIAANQGAETSESEGELQQLLDILRRDPTIFTAWTQGGLSIESDAIVSLDASKLTGDIASARMTANLVAAWNSLTGFDAGKLTTGDLAAAQMTTNLVSAWNSLTGFDASKLTTGALAGARYSASLVATWNSLTGYSAAALTAGSLPSSQMTGNLVAAWNSLTGFDASKLTTGTLAVARLGVTAGTIAASLPVVVNASKQVNEWTVTGATDLQGATKLAGSGSTLGFYGATGVTKPAIFSNTVTNSIGSGHQSGNIYDFANFSSPVGGPYNFTNDAPILFSNMYKLVEFARLVNNSLLRGTGMAS